VLKLLLKRGTSHRGRVSLAHLLECAFVIGSDENAACVRRLCGDGC
jgi:hypothetical protein